MKSTMNSIELRGIGSKETDKLKLKLAVFTENLLMFEEVKKERLVVKLQLKLGKTKDALRKILAALYNQIGRAHV